MIKIKFKSILQTIYLGSLILSFEKNSAAETNYHLCGLLNTFIPGGGQLYLGNYAQGLLQTTYETASFLVGLKLSGGEVFSLDGFTSALPVQRFKKKTIEVSATSGLFGDIFQEFALKSHMVNTFNAYRDAAIQARGSLPEGIEDKSTLNLFLEPFKSENLLNPWVYSPLAILFSATLIDYFNTIQLEVSRTQRLTSASNFLYTFNAGLWQTTGSGAPEEMFYRGFLQNEFMSWVPSPYFAIPLSTALFVLSHQPGEGRVSAAVAGAYLGYLAHRSNGRLGPGITLHFWSGIILGVEAILLSQHGQHSTPPAAFFVQINY